MNPDSGVAVFALGIAGFLFLRYYLLLKLRDDTTPIYRDLVISSIEGCNQGPLIYLISIITVIIGPLSYKVVLMNPTEYIILNVIGAIFFVSFYPQISPVTGLSTIDVLVKGKERYCVAGKFMRRKLKVLSIIAEKEIEIKVQKGRDQCTFHTYKKKSNRNPFNQS